jgi:hypothetical protein
MPYHESDWERREQDRDIDQPAGYQPAGFHGKGYQKSGWEKREQELGEGLSEWELREHSGLSDQELSRLKNTTPQRVFWIVVGSALLLLLIVVIVGANMFHWS